MSLKVNTIPAKITEDMDVDLMFFITTSNNYINQIAEILRNSDVNKLDPNDGRVAVITISVNPKTGSIEYSKEFIFPTE